MNAEQTPFRPGWYGTDLGAYRPCDGTYCLYPYESLPPLPDERFRGDFAWLGVLDASLDRTMEVYRPPQAARERMAARVGQLAMAARRLGLTLPAPFLGFMGAVDLQARIPSCTACYFDLSGRIIPCPGRDDAYLIRFLNDQQDVLMWYLYLNRAGDHCVVVSPVYFDDEPLAPEVAAAVGDYGFHCAPSFEAFVYRFWLENRIWFALSEGDMALTEEMQAYLDHYGSARGQA